MVEAVGDHVAPGGVGPVLGGGGLVHGPVRPGIVAGLEPADRRGDVRKMVEWVDQPGDYGQRSRVLGITWGTFIARYVFKIKSSVTTRRGRPSRRRRSPCPSMTRTGRLDPNTDWFKQIGR